MRAKNDIKEKAITLRQEGKTYGEILAVVPVAKSTLSLWLREVSLAHAQKQRLTVKRIEAQKRGAVARRTQRVASTKDIHAKSLGEIGKLSVRERMLIGAALYWAEGAKEKTYRPSVRMDFANSDPAMIRFYLRWVREVLRVEESDIILIVHLHDSYKPRLGEVTKFWLNVTGLKPQNCAKPVIKKHKPKTVRKNTGEAYNGLANIRLRRSVALNRQTQGWIYGIISAR